MRISNSLKSIGLLSGSDLMVNALSIVTLPIISRIHPVDSFATLALYWTFTSILGVIATGRYDLALVASETYEDNVALLNGALLFCVVSAPIQVVVMYLLVYGFHFGIEIPSLFIVTCTISILLNALYQVLYCWANYRKYYTSIAKIKVTSRVAIILGQVAFGFLPTLGYGLVYGSIIGQTLGLMMMIYSLSRLETNLSRPVASALLALKKHRNYPLYLIPSGLLESFSSKLHLLLFGQMFGQEVLGHIGFYQRIVNLPLTAASNSVGLIFRQQAGELAQAGQPSTKLLLKTAGVMALIAILPTIAMAAIGPQLFAVVFGEKWRIAGEYSQILVWTFFAGMVVSPISFLLYIGKKQKLDLYLQIFLLVAILGAIYAGTSLFHSVHAALWGFTLAYVIKYLVEFLVAYKISQNRI